MGVSTEELANWLPYIPSPSHLLQDILILPCFGYNFNHLSAILTNNLLCEFYSLSFKAMFQEAQCLPYRAALRRKKARLRFQPELAFAGEKRTASCGPFCRLSRGEEEVQIKQYDHAQDHAQGGQQQFFHVHSSPLTRPRWCSGFRTHPDRRPGRRNR